MSFDDHEVCRRCGHRDCVGGLACLDRADEARRKTPPSASSSAPAAALSYGSDNAGGLHLCVGDARVHLTHAQAIELAEGLTREANLPPTPMRGLR